MHTEVTNLPNLSGYLRFGRNLPVMRFDDRFNPLKNCAAGFVERTVPAIRLDLAKTLVKIAHAESKVRETMEAEKAAGKKVGRKSQAAPAFTAPVDGAGNADDGEHAATQPDLFAARSVIPAGVPIEDVILAADEGELPVSSCDAWEMVGVRAGQLANHLVQHAENDGPRHDARPA